MTSKIPKWKANTDEVTFRITQFCVKEFERTDMHPGQALSILGGIRLFFLKRLFKLDTIDEAKDCDEILRDSGY